MGEFHPAIHEAAFDRVNITQTTGSASTKDILLGYDYGGEARVVHFVGNVDGNGLAWLQVRPGMTAEVANCRATCTADPFAPAPEKAMGWRYDGASGLLGAGLMLALVVAVLWRAARQERKC